jgi:hypothetical protein
MHFFFVQVYRGLKSCFFLLKNISLLDPTRNVRDFLTINVRPSNNPCSSARYTYAASAVGKNLDIFAIGAFIFNHIL